MPRRKINRNHRFARTLIREWRRYRELTQDDLLARLPEGALSKASLSRLENAKQPYTQDVLEMIAAVLGCKPADLLSRDPHDPEGIWSVWERAKPGQRRRIVQVAKALVEVDD